MGLPITGGSDEHHDSDELEHTFFRGDVNGEKKGAEAHARRFEDVDHIVCNSTPVYL